MAGVRTHATFFAKRTSSSSGSGPVAEAVVPGRRDHDPLAALPGEAVGGAVGGVGAAHAGLLERAAYRARGPGAGRAPPRGRGAATSRAAASRAARCRHREGQDHHPGAPRGRLAGPRPRPRGRPRAGRAGSGSGGCGGRSGRESGKTSSARPAASRYRRDAWRPEAARPARTSRKPYSRTVRPAAHPGAWQHEVLGVGHHRHVRPEDAAQRLVQARQRSPRGARSSSRRGRPPGRCGWPRRRAARATTEGALAATSGTRAQQEEQPAASRPREHPGSGGGHRGRRHEVRPQGEAPRTARASGACRGAAAPSRVAGGAARRSAAVRRTSPQSTRVVG